MRRDLISSVLAIVALTVVLRARLPAASSPASSQVVFPGKANGSKVERNGKLVGSRLLAQDFRKPVLDANGKPKTDTDGNPVLTPDPRYFQPRPSTATSYNAAATAFTNLGPEQQGRPRHVQGQPRRLPRSSSGRYDPGLTARAVPVDAVTSSASGVDPHISAGQRRDPGAPHRRRPPPPARARAAS